MTDRRTTSQDEYCPLSLSFIGDFLRGEGHKTPAAHMHSCGHSPSRHDPTRRQQPMTKQDEVHVATQRTKLSSGTELLGGVACKDKKQKHARNKTERQRQPTSRLPNREGTTIGNITTMEHPTAKVQAMVRHRIRNYSSQPPLYKKDNRTKKPPIVGRAVACRYDGLQ